MAVRSKFLSNSAEIFDLKYAAISAGSSGNNTAVAAVTGRKIRVMQVFLLAAGAVDVRFEDGAGGTALTGIMSLAANGGFVMPFSPIGWFETTAATLLNIELGGAVQVSGCIAYAEV